MAWIVLGQIAVGLVETAAAIFILLFCVLGCMAVWQDMLAPRWNRQMYLEPTRRDMAIAAERKVRKQQIQKLRLRLRRLEKGMTDKMFYEQKPK